MILFSLYFNSNAVCWCAEGVCFEIKDRALLGDALADHFRHRKFSSFQRQLNYFGFKHVGRGIYMHPSFSRDDRDQALRISRKTRAKPKLTTVKDSEMNFDDIIAQEDSALLEFLPNDQNITSKSNALRDPQLTSDQLEEQRQRQLKLQLQLKHHLQNHSMTGTQHADQLAGYPETHRENVPQVYMVPVCVKAQYNSSQQTPFFSAPLSQSMWELQYQVSIFETDSLRFAL
jgi:hypothetical protein